MVKSEKLYTPQTYCEKLTGYCYCFKQDNTVAEIEAVLKKHGLQDMHWNYALKDDVYGVYSGVNLQNIFSVTTQMPNTIEIVSNNESMRCRKIMIDGRTIILRKSRCKIDRTNVGAYTILQLISDMGIDEDMNNRAKDSILKYMKDNSVNNAALLSLARIFPAQTTKKLMYSGVLNGFTQ